MSDNPLIDTPEREERTRHRAYLLWQEDGCPDGRDKEFWERADFLIRMEDSKGAGQLPNPATQNEPIPGVQVEEARIQENYGEFPDRLADQGDRRQTPMTREEMHESQHGKTPPTRGDALKA
jgi:hypothetical protein